MAVSLATKTYREARILDFDIETRKIGFHIGGRFNPDGCEPVVLAASWVGDDKISTFSLGTTWKEKDLRSILEAFVKLYNQADIVTGHYVMRFDLPILNGSLLEFGYAPLGEKLVVDTKTHLKNTAGHSASQENLAALHKLEASKFHMNDVMWRSMCRLTPDGLALAKERVTGDIVQHKQIYKALLPWLDEPTSWV